MAAITWDGTGERKFEVGVDRGVFYPYDPVEDEYVGGVAWNGLTQVDEKDEGGEDNEQYADNIVYANIRSEIEFEGTIEAFTYPDEFAECDGSAQPEEGVFIGQQPRKPFGFAYRSLIGDDLNSIDAGYKLHLVYKATAEPSEKSRETINDSPEAQTMSWDFKTDKTPVTGLKPTAHIVIDSTRVDSAALEGLEDILYGESGTPEMPLPDAVLAMFQ